MNNPRLMEDGHIHAGWREEESTAEGCRLLQAGEECDGLCCDLKLVPRRGKMRVTKREKDHK